MFLEDFYRNPFSRHKHVCHRAESVADSAWCWDHLWWSNVKTRLLWWRLKSAKSNSRMNLFALRDRTRCAKSPQSFHAVAAWSINSCFGIAGSVICKTIAYMTKCKVSSVNSNLCLPSSNFRAADTTPDGMPFTSTGHAFCPETTYL